MKNLLFILLFLPLFAFPQAEKPYRSIIIDSVKALNGGRIDVKDTLLLDSLAVYKSDLSSQYTSRSLVDSAFVGIAVSSGGANTIYNADDNLAGSRIVTLGGNTLTFSGNQTTFKGISTTSANFVALFQDNAGVDLLNVRNDGNVGIGVAVPLATLHVKAPGTTSSLQDIAFFHKSDAFKTGISLRASQSAAEISAINVGAGDGKRDLMLSYQSAGSVRTEGIRITGDGDVGIAISLPVARLNVRGIDATSGNFALLIEDNVGTDLFSIRNDGNIGIGTSSPAASAILDITSTIGAVLFPRMTTAQRDALTAVNGMVIYNSTLDKLQVRAAGAWVSLH